MTVNNEENKVQYNGNGSQTSFSFNKGFFADSDLSVVVTDTSTGLDTNKVLNSDYTISGTPTGGPYASGANVVFSVAPSATDRITIYRNIPFKQPEDYIENDAFPAEIHERALDRVTYLCQQLKEQVQRALVLPVSTTLSNLILPSTSADKAICFNETGTGLDLSISDIRTLISADATANAANVTECVLGVNTAKIVTPDGLAALWEKGADIASATTITIPTTKGGYFEITGTTTINGISEASTKTGRIVRLYFQNSLTLTHNSTSFILPNFSNYVTKAGETIDFVCINSTSNYWRMLNKKQIPQTAEIIGGTVTNNATDATNDFDISPFTCWDDTFTEVITIASSLTKQTDTVFAEGTNQGCWASGTKASGDTVHVFGIKNASTGQCEVLAFNTLTPTLPTGYTHKRFLFSFPAMVGTTLTQILHLGDLVLHKVPVNDVAVSNLGPTRTNYTLSVPNGRQVIPVGTFNFGHATLTPAVMLTSPSQTETTPSVNSGDYYAFGSGSYHSSLPEYLVTNTSKQISADSDTANTILRVRLHGYIDIFRQVL